MAAAAEIVDLISSDEENSSPNKFKKRSSDLSGSKSRKKRAKRHDHHINGVICLDLTNSDSEEENEPTTAAAFRHEEEDSEEEEDIVEVAPPVAAYKTDKNAEQEEEQNQDDDDVAVIGKVFSALSDFPHSREHCVTHPHAQDPTRHCPNCFCYVCDALASSCPSWQTHCHATHGNPQWRTMREQVRNNGGVLAAPPPPRAMSSSTVRNAPPPPPLNVDGRPDLDDYSLVALLQAATSVHPVEISPPAGVFTTNLRHYQKQSVAFMREEERRRAPKGATRGGWLCDELGMGKSAVVLALIASNPLAPDKCPSRQQVLQAAASSSPTNSSGRRLKVKATVIMTSVSLIGQWQDECRKHAPGLKVARHHGTKKISYRDLQDLDVIISSSTFKWDPVITNNYSFRRVVVDESHLFATAPVSAKIEHAIRIHSRLKWCVTATPCVSSVSDLYKQLVFLNGTYSDTNGNYHRSAAIQAAWTRYGGCLSQRSSQVSRKQAFYGLVDELKRCMIRHTKSQRIGGSDALALPESTTTTVMLNMTPQERRMFGHAHASRDSMNSMKKTGAKAMRIQQCFSFRMYDWNPNQSLSKIQALVQDLRELRRSDHAFRVVVFTQSLVMHSFVVKALKSEGLNTLQFSGSTAAAKRDRTIRSFQNQTDQNPAVFVITLRSGNVGITLTAASRVYLMEPSMDPAAEVQAAGRIHRLGQTKQVQVKKYVFANSVESNIVKLHKEIANGRIAISDGFFPPAAVKILAKDIPTKAA